jgi:hypothetical protein
MFVINAQQSQTGTNVSAGVYGSFLEFSDNEKIGAIKWSDGSYDTQGILYPTAGASVNFQTMVNSSISAIAPYYPTHDTLMLATTGYLRKVFNFVSLYQSVQVLSYTSQIRWFNSPATTLGAVFHSSASWIQANITPLVQTPTEYTYLVYHADSGASTATESGMQIIKNVRSGNELTITKGNYFTVTNQSSGSFRYTSIFAVNPAKTRIVEARQRWISNTNSAVDIRLLEIDSTTLQITQLVTWAEVANITHETSLGINISINFWDTDRFGIQIGYKTTMHFVLYVLGTVSGSTIIDVATLSAINVGVNTIKSAVLTGVHKIATNKIALAYSTSPGLNLNVVQLNTNNTPASVGTSITNNLFSNTDFYFQLDTDKFLVNGTLYTVATTTITAHTYTIPTGFGTFMSAKQVDTDKFLIYGTQTTTNFPCVYLLEVSGTTVTTSAVYVLNTVDIDTTTRGQAYIGDITIAGDNFFSTLSYNRNVSNNTRISHTTNKTVIIEKSNSHTHNKDIHGYFFDISGLTITNLEVKRLKYATRGSCGGGDNKYIHIAEFDAGIYYFMTLNSTTNVSTSLIHESSVINGTDIVDIDIELNGVNVANINTVGGYYNYSGSYFLVPQAISINHITNTGALYIQALNVGQNYTQFKIHKALVQVG